MEEKIGQEDKVAEDSEEETVKVSEEETVEVSEEETVMVDLRSQDGTMMATMTEGQKVDLIAALLVVAEEEEKIFALLEDIIQMSVVQLMVMMAPLEVEEEEEIALTLFTEEVVAGAVASMTDPLILLDSKKMAKEDSIMIARNQDCIIETMILVTLKDALAGVA